MKKIAILQPNYIPWKGVFDLISRVDVFVFLDDVQYTRKDWRNRNKIRTTNGDVWLTVPVKTKGLRHQLICDAEIENTYNWQHKHYRTIKNSYCKSGYFKEFEILLNKIYIDNKWTKISDLDIFSTKLIAETLGINVEWYRSSDLGQTGDKGGEKIVKICKMLGCGYFINGPASRAFMDEQIFIENDIILDYIDYNYPEYKQLHNPFCHNVSILDVIFNCGYNAKNLVCLGK